MKTVQYSEYNIKGRTIWGKVQGQYTLYKIIVKTTCKNVVIVAENNIKKKMKSIDGRKCSWSIER